MLGAGDLRKQFTFSLRYADTDTDRARWRFTADYAPVREVKVGIEYNPAVGEIGFRGTWEALPETAHRPLVLFGTSSDRIGTPRGNQAYYLTVAKSLPGLPVGAYASLHYSEFEDRFIYPFGVSCDPTPNVGVIGMNDGRHTHALITYREDDYSLTMMWLWLRRPGVALTWGF